MKVNDKKIIKYLKYLPFYFLIVTTLLFVIYIFIDNFIKIDQEKNKLTIELTEQYQANIKSETLKVVDYISKQQAMNQEKLIQTLKEKNHTAYSIINNIYQENKNKPKNEIISQIKTALDKIRFFNGRGYYYILGLDDAYCYLHPVFKELQNRSLLEVKDAKGVYLSKEMIKILQKKDEGHLNYHWFKEGDKINQYEKIAYLKKFEPLNIFIVSSDYVDSLTKKWKDEVKLFLESVNFQDNSHYFIIDSKTKKYGFHKQKDFIQKSIKEAGYVIDPEKLIFDLTKPNTNGFYSYDVKLKNGNIVKKTSYIYTIKDWNWIIGIGYYDEDINDVIKKENKHIEQTHFNNLIDTLIFMLIICLFTFFISRYISKIIEGRFKIYNFSINRKIVEIGRQQRVMAQQSKMIAMAEMIENIAHQWRQPLSIITTAASGLKLNKEYGNLDDKTFDDSIKSINDSAQYLSSTIEDFRSFYEDSSEEKNFRIDETIEKSLQLLKPKVESMNIKIEKEIRKINYSGFENELLQVLLNIINNSIDQFIFNEELKNYIIKIELIKNDTNTIIEITDNGGGIQSNLEERIFEPYFTTKNKNIGTGIGLYMAKNIIEKHFHGTITAKNIIFTEEENTHKGAKFSIVIG